MEQVEQLEEQFNAVAVTLPSINGDSDSDSGSEAIAEAAKSSAPLARRVKVGNTQQQNGGRLHEFHWPTPLYDVRRV